MQQDVVRRCVRTMLHRFLHRCQPLEQVAMSVNAGDSLPTPPWSMRSSQYHILRGRLVQGLPAIWIKSLPHVLRLFNNIQYVSAQVFVL